MLAIPISASPRQNVVSSQDLDAPCFSNAVWARKRFHSVRGSVSGWSEKSACPNLPQNFDFAFYIAPVIVQDIVLSFFFELTPRVWGKLVKSPSKISHIHKQRRDRAKTKAETWSAYSKYKSKIANRRNNRISTELKIGISKNAKTGEKQTEIFGFERRKLFRRILNRTCQSFLSSQAAGSEAENPRSENDQAECDEELINSSSIFHKHSVKV